MPVKGYFLFVCLVLVFVVACKKEQDDTGYDVFPDMRYRAQTLQTSRVPFVSIEDAPYLFPKGVEGRDSAGLLLQNPIPFDSVVFQRGEELYRANCAQCHGIKGDSRGSLITSGVYLYRPAKLNGEIYRHYPDGAFYHVITVGHKLMGAHAEMVQPDDRWRIAHYLKRMEN